MNGAKSHANKIVAHDFMKWNNVTGFWKPCFPIRAPLWRRTSVIQKHFPTSFFGFHQYIFPNKLIHWAYKFAYAGAIIFSFFFRPAVRGVNVAIWREGELLLVKNSYRRVYTLPGGYVKIGESPKAAAIRELEEEVGLKVYPNQLKHALQCTFTASYKRETVDIFDMTLEKDTSLAIDNREVVWAGFMPPEKALSKKLSLPAKQYLDALHSNKFSGPIP